MGHELIPEQGCDRMLDRAQRARPEVEARRAPGQDRFRRRRRLNASALPCASCSFRSQGAISARDVATRTANGIHLRRFNALRQAATATAPSTGSAHALVSPRQSESDPCAQARPDRPARVQGMDHDEHSARGQRHSEGLGWYIADARTSAGDAAANTSARRCSGRRWGQSSRASRRTRMQTASPAAAATSWPGRCGGPQPCSITPRRSTPTSANQSGGVCQTPESSAEGSRCSSARVAAYWSFA